MAQLCQSLGMFPAQGGMQANLSEFCMQPRPEQGALPPVTPTGNTTNCLLLDGTFASMRGGTKQLQPPCAGDVAHGEPGLVSVVPQGTRNICAGTAMPMEEGEGYGCMSSRNSASEGSSFSSRCSATHLMSTHTHKAPTTATPTTGRHEQQLQQQQQQSEL